MGLFDFLRGSEQKAMPEPGTPEWDAAVSGSALPGSVDMGEEGWTSTSKRVDLPGFEAGKVEHESSQTIDLRGTGAREDVEKVLREHGIDPDKQGQTIDASTVPGLQEAILGALGQSGLNIPNSGGFGGGVSPPKQDNLAVIEHLAAKRDAGEISEAEFEAQKRELLGGGS
jgi:hypothetical protein